ncbi:MAG: sulfur oxidation c-type cytochrome SoxX [Pseudorhodobacter sp.]
MKHQGILAFAALTFAGAMATAEIMPENVAYTDGAIEASLTGSPGDPIAGEKVMTTASLGNCVACHSVDALDSYPFHGNIGPMLDGAADRWTEAELRGIVANAKMMFDGSFMPAFYKSGPYIRPGNGYTGKAAEGALPPILSAQQIEDIVAYLMTLKE